MLIIELIGLPGSGKSTVIEQSLQMTSQKLVLRDDLLNDTVSRCSFREKIRRTHDKLIISSLYFFSEKSQGKKYYDRLTALLDHLYSYKEKNNDSVLLLEEGFVQYLSSLAYDKDLSVSFFLARLIRRVFRDFVIILVDCQISVDESIRRIKARHKTGDRYNISDETHQRYLLEKKLCNLKKVVKYYGSIKYTMDMTNRPEMNALFLVKLIEANL